MAVANSFASLVGGLLPPSMSSSSSSLLAAAKSLARAIEIEAIKLGYERILNSINHSPIFDGEVSINFELEKAKGKTYATAIVVCKDHIGRNNEVEVRLRSLTGFSKDLESAIHKLLSNEKGESKASSGLPPELQGGDAQGVGSKPLAQDAGGPDGGGSGAAQTGVAAAAVTMLDLVTVRRQLASPERTRRYIGSSGISNECDAYQALTLRGFPGDLPAAQLQRIFDDGHRIEAELVADLKDSGHKVEEFEKGDEQWEFTSHGGHHVTHLDGFITLMGSTDRRILEIKSMNAASFKKFVEKGVALSHPHYFAQVQDQLALAIFNGVAVKECFFIAKCKDNSKYHAEIVAFSNSEANRIFAKVDRLVGAESHRRASTYKGAYECSGCFKRTSCWEPNVQDRGCHHCANAIPEADLDSRQKDKRWICKLSGSHADKTCSSFTLWRPEKL
jgi:hypothetical protein